MAEYDNGLLFQVVLQISFTLKMKIKSQTVILHTLPLTIVSIDSIFTLKPFV